MAQLSEDAKAFGPLMTIEQAAEKHLAALQRVTQQIEERMEEEEIFYERI